MKKVSCRVSFQRSSAVFLHHHLLWRQKLKRFNGPDRAKEKKKRLSETRKKLSEAIAKEGYNGVNVFENTEPLSSGGQVGASAAPSSPLSGYAPNDAGINIEGLLSVAGKNWSKLI